MEFTTVKELYHNTDAYIGKEITVGGWVRSNRDSKAFGFIVLHDGTFFETLQVVYSDQLENFAEICKINVGAAVIVKGTLVATRLRFRLQVWSLREHPLRITRCRRSAILWNICVPCRICVRVPIRFRLYSVCVL